MTRASNSANTGDDVVMREDNEADHLSSSRSESRRGITTKREPREVTAEETGVTEHLPHKAHEH